MVDKGSVPDGQSVIEPLWIGRNGIALAAIVKDDADKVIGFCWLEPVHRNYGGKAMYNVTYRSDGGAWMGSTADSFAAAALAVRGHAGFHTGACPEVWWQRVDELSVDARRQLLLLPSERHWELRERELEEARNEIASLEAENARLLAEIQSLKTGGQIQLQLGVA